MNLNAELIRSLEWKRFEELCTAWFKQRGIVAKETPLGPDGGIDIKLYHEGASSPSALAQCKAWNSLVGVKELREFLGVLTHEGIKKGFYLTSSDFTEDAKALAKANNIVAINGVMLAELIAQMPEETQNKLYALATEGDYTTPTCPTCGIKMVPRSGALGKFWGCKNYPRCKQRLHMRKDAKKHATFVKANSEKAREYVMPQVVKEYAIRRVKKETESHLQKFITALAIKLVAPFFIGLIPLVFIFKFLDSFELKNTMPQSQSALQQTSTTQSPAQQTSINNESQLRAEEARRKAELSTLQAGQVLETGREQEEFADQQLAMDARAMEDAWSKYYRKSPACQRPDSNFVECGNEYRRARNKFEKEWADGKLSQRPQ